MKSLLEPRRVQVASGPLEPSEPVANLAKMYPFTQQIDITFSSDAPSKHEAVASVLQALQIEYTEVQSALLDFVERIAPSFSRMAYLSAFQALSICPSSEDHWCIDQRGVLTLSVCKDVYQRLGLLGEKLPSKNAAERYVIRVPLQEEGESVKIRAKVKSALKAWDERRAEPWRVLCHLPDGQQLEGGDIRSSQCISRTFSSMHVPLPTIPTRPSSKDDEDWHDTANVLFEWVGMACMGSERLQANDRVDPFVAVYEPPAASHVASVTHFRWHGLLPPSFVQTVIDTALKHLPSASPSSDFISITAHAFPAVPVTFIPRSSFAPGAGRNVRIHSPMRVPSDDAEDTWSLLLLPPAANEPNPRWIHAQSVGQYDTRWG